MKTKEGLAFKNLSTKEQQAYKAMLAAFSVYASFVDCTALDPGIGLLKIMDAVISDNPTITYFNKTLIQVEESHLGRRMLLTGVQPKPQAQKMSRTLDEHANAVISYLKTTPRDDDYTKLVRIHEFLQKNVKYDIEEFNARTNNTDTASHNAFGAIVKRLSVCDGFASAFTLLAQKLGFDCMMMSGKSTHKSAAAVPHAWNIVKIGNCHYHIDTTWDATSCQDFGELFYTYFCITDREIKKSHTWDTQTTPVCSCKNLSYYAKNGTIVTNEIKLNETIKNFIKDFTKQKTDVYRVKISSGCNLPNDPGDYLAQKFLKTVCQATQADLQINYTWNNDIRCFICKIEK
ncbi:MAG: hypothetical protein FWG63_04615 [Defluviitaleaceae bacterium]|nr:hypothetical protein [Defluviitaleaceae bacterium]